MRFFFFPNGGRNVFMHCFFGNQNAHWGRLGSCRNESVAFIFEVTL